MNTHDSKKAPRLRERDFIRQLAPRIAAPQGSPVPFGDDMALAAPLDYLATTDMLMDGVDFESEHHAWRDIGYKALAVNLSDCAAMAAAPISALVAVALDDRLAQPQIDELMTGILACGQEYGCPIVGGDTNSWSKPTVISITVFGKPPTRRGPVGRHTAEVGDKLYVTGQLGGSILGRHLRPKPRLALAIQLAVKASVHALIDISDGLAIDADRVAEASGVGIELDEALLPAIIHPDAERLAAQTGRTPLEHALHDGEDFELLAALPTWAGPGAQKLGLLPVGRVIAENGLWIATAAGERKALEPRGWEHLA